MNHLTDSEITVISHRPGFDRLYARLLAEPTALSRNLEDHGEITPRAYRELKETVRDLAANVLGRPDVPRTEAATSFVAD
jgi:hypothetical protein